MGELAGQNFIFVAGEASKEGTCCTVEEVNAVVLTTAEDGVSFWMPL